MWFIEMQAVLLCWDVMKSRKPVILYSDDKWGKSGNSLLYGIPKGDSDTHLPLIKKTTTFKLVGILATMVTRAGYPWARGVLPDGPGQPSASRREPRGAAPCPASCAQVGHSPL